jgi:hypothetical protein
VDFLFRPSWGRFYVFKGKAGLNEAERVKLRTLPYFQAINFNLEVEHPTTHCIKEVLIIT